MGPIEETIACFVEEVFNNDSLLQSERKQMIKSTMLDLGRYVSTEGYSKQCANALVGNGIKIARQRRKMGRTEVN